AQGIAEEDALGRHRQHQPAVAPAHRLDQTQLAETVGDLDEMIVRHFELGSDFGNRDRRGAIMLAEIHEHAQAKIGKTGELHGRGVSGKMELQTSEYRSCTDKTTHKSTLRQ